MVADATKTTSSPRTRSDDTQPIPPVRLAVRNQGPGRNQQINNSAERIRLRAQALPSRPGLVLPVPPRDDEKFRYVRRAGQDAQGLAPTTWPRRCASATPPARWSTTSGSRAAR